MSTQWGMGLLPRAALPHPEGLIAAALRRCLLNPMLLARLCSLKILNTCATSAAAAGTTLVCSGTCCSLRPSSSERRGSCAFPLGVAAQRLGRPGCAGGRTRRDAERRRMHRLTI